MMSVRRVSTLFSVLVCLCFGMDLSNVTKCEQVLHLMDVCSFPSQLMYRGTMLLFADLYSQLLIIESVRNQTFVGKLVSPV